MDLNKLKRGEKEIVITEHEAITVEKHGRGASATVTDSYSPFNNETSFASTPETALWMLNNKLSALREEVII